MHPRYQEWVDYFFDNEVPPAERELELWPHEASGAEQAGLIIDIFSRSGTDLQAFSDAQVNQGIWDIASGAGSGFTFSLKKGGAPLDQRKEAVRSILVLYRDCFARRCTEVLGHLDEDGASDLNPICYMFWDSCALTYLADEEALELKEVVLQVLEQILHIPHRACVEGALHGLGHFADQFPEEVGKCIDAFLATARVDDGLRNYAESARTGGIL